MEVNMAKKKAKSEAKPNGKPAAIVQWDVDAANYLGNEEDGVYWQVAKGADGWYVTVVVDSNTGGFCTNAFTDHGPYQTEGAANTFGQGQAIEWCVYNSVPYEGEKPDSENIASTDLFERKIWVSCPTCGMDYDESDPALKIEGIEEDVQGRDLLTFTCPEGHKCKSLRRG